MSNGYGFKYIAALLGLALGVAVAAFADDLGFPAPTGDPAFVPAGAKLVRLFDGGCMLTEGVAAGHDGMISFSDITFTKFCKDSSGTYLQTGKNYILSGLFNGRPYNALNDLSLDEKGRIYCSDPHYLGHEPIE